MSRRSVKSDISVSVEIVTRSDIPKEFYLSKPAKNDWKRIFHFTFSNGFDYYFGTNKSYVDGDELIAFLCVELEYVNMSNDFIQLHNNIKEDNNSKITYANCKKLFKWYKPRRTQVEEIIEQFLD